MRRSALFVASCSACALALVLACVACSQAPRGNVVPPTSSAPAKPPVRPMRVSGFLTSVGSDSGSAADGRPIFRRVISVGSRKRQSTSERDFVFVDSTVLKIDGRTTGSSSATAKAESIGSTPLDGTASVVVSYEASSGPQLGRPGTSHFFVATSIAIDTRP